MFYYLAGNPKMLCNFWHLFDKIKCVRADLCNFLQVINCLTISNGFLRCAFKILRILGTMRLKHYTVFKLNITYLSDL
jgi:hypothetical protein